MGFAPVKNRQNHSPLIIRLQDTYNKTIQIKKVYIKKYYSG